VAVFTRNSPRLRVSPVASTFRLPVLLSILTLCLSHAFGAGASTPTAKSLNDAGTRHLLQGQLQLALEHFLKAARLSPADPSIQFNLGLTWVRLGQAQKALPPLTLAGKESSLRDEAAYLKGLALFELKRHEECVSQIEHLQNKPQFAENVLYLLTESHRYLQRAAESEKAFAELLRQFPSSPLVHKLLGMAYDAQNRPEDAIREFELALKGNPALPGANFAIGYIHWKQQRLEQASPWLEKELKVQPCYAPAHYYLGDIARKAQQLSQARQKFRQAVNCDESYGDAYFGLGTLCELEGEFDQAIEMYRKAVLLDPEKSEVHYKLARALLKAGRKAESEAEMQRVNQLKAEVKEKAASALK
jgi:tetratricopeptide (TPR) repeat protein